MEYSDDIVGAFFHQPARWKQKGYILSGTERSGGNSGLGKKKLGVRMSLKKGRRAFVGGLALTGMGAGTVTGLLSSSARGADENAVASRTVGVGWEKRRS